MIELACNLWDPQYDGWWRGITTNGFVKANGECVMGRGVALQAKRRYPWLARRVGDLITTNGNVPWRLPVPRLFTFPVKHVWSEPADLALIAQSVGYLDTWARAIPEERYLLPRPGCGNGQRSWEEVRPLCAGLPDNVYVVDLPRRKA